MTYPEWVERVLGALMLNYDELRPEPTNLLQVGVTLGLVNQVPVWNPHDPLLVAIAHAVGDLERLGLARVAGGGVCALITHDGRSVARAGMRSLWPGFFSQSLEEQAQAALAAASTIAQTDHGTYVTMRTVTNLELSEQWSWLADTRPAAAALEQLVAAGFDRGSAGSVTSGWVTFRPTYAGVVRSIEAEQTEIQQLCEILLREWETANVDFKRELHVNTREQKAEFVRDVLALATTNVRGPRYLVVGFDDKTRAFHTPVDASITPDRLENILSAYASPPPEIRYMTAEWPAGGGRFAIVEVIRNPAHVPYRASRDLARSLKAGAVWVRHGSHVETPTPAELADLEAEGRAAACPPPTRASPS